MGEKEKMEKVKDEESGFHQGCRSLSQRKADIEQQTTAEWRLSFLIYLS